MRFTVWLAMLPVCICAQPAFLTYSSYLGGNGVDVVHGVATDSAGNVYVTGETTSSDFPVTAGAVQARHGGVAGATFGLLGPPALPDAFVAKINSAGRIVYATYLGGSASDFGLRIAVDSQGSAYVLGGTYSTNFPTTLGAFQKTSDGQGAAFLAKLSADGSSLLYSTYAGKISTYSGYQPGALFASSAAPGALAVDASGDVFFGGSATPASFPATTGAYSNTGGAFVAELNPAGTALTFVTYLGGTGSSTTRRIALDATGNIYAAGDTSSTDFPITSGALHANTSTTQSAAFVVKLDPAGAHALYSATIGGNGGAGAFGLAVDGQGSAYLGGVTTAPDFPSGGANPAGNEDGFIARLSASGSQLLFATRLAGSGVDTVEDLSIDSSGRIFVAGETTSTDFPVTAGALPKRFVGSVCLLTGGSPFGNPPALAPCGDAFAARLTATGAVDYATYLSGSDSDDALAIAAKADGSIWVGGSTRSSDFPTAGAAASDRHAAGACVEAGSPSSQQSFSCEDGFLAAIAFGSAPPAPALRIVNTGSLLEAPIAPAAVVTLFGSGLGPDTPVKMQLTADGRVPTTLANVQVLFNGVAAPLLTVSSDQVTAIVPDSVAGNAHVPVGVQKAGQTVASTGAVVVGTQAALLTFDPSGSGQVAAINPDGTVNSASNPAPAGSYVALYAIGLGATSDGDGGVAAAPVARSGVQVVLGASPLLATVLYAGTSPGSISALTQINVKLPSNLAGEVPVFILSGGMTSQAGMTVEVK